MGGAVAGCVAAGLFLALVLRRAKAVPPPAAGPDAPLVLRHGRPVLALGLVNTFVVPAVITVLVLVSPPRPDEWGDVAALYALFVALGAPLAWEAARFELRVGPAGLDHRSAWLGRAAVPWADVRAVSYSGVNGWFVVHTADGRARRLSVLVPGAAGFLAACERHLPPAALTGARAGYQALGRPFPDGDA